MKELVLHRRLSSFLPITFNTNRTFQNITNPLDDLQQEVKGNVEELFPAAKELDHSLPFVTPPSHIQADYAISTFPIASNTGMNPNEIALRIVEKISASHSPLIGSIKSMGPYVNIEVDKSLFEERAIDYILNNRKKHNHSDQTILIHYLDIDFASSISLDNLRKLLVGRALGKFFEKKGHTVKHRIFYRLYAPEDAQKKDETLKELQKIYRELSIHAEYSFDNEFGTASLKVTEELMKSSLAEHVSNTRAVILSPVNDEPSFVLQKNNGMVTDFAKKLAFIRTSHSTRAAQSIFIGDIEEQQKNESLLSSAKALQSLPSNCKISNISIIRSNPEIVDPFDRSLHYTILRTSLDKSVNFDTQHSSCYNKIINFMTNEAALDEKETMDPFRLIQLLISFERVITQSANLLDPSHVCVYIEEILLVAKNTQPKSKKINMATVLTLENIIKTLCI